MRKIKAIAYEENPRKITEIDAAKLKADLEEFGDLSGIVLDTNSNRVVGGHQRLTVMMGVKAGEFQIKDADIEIIKEYPKPTKGRTVSVGFLNWRGERFNFRTVKYTEDQFKRANVLANRDGGTWNYEKLAANFSSAELMNLGFDNNLLDQMKEEQTALSNILSNEPRLQEKTESLRPKEFMRVLVSIPVNQAIEAKELFDALEKINGIEIDYGAN